MSVIIIQFVLVPCYYYQLVLRLSPLFPHLVANIHLHFGVVQMEGIPSKARTLRMNLTMGKLYRISRNNRAASTCYKECLR